MQERAFMIEMSIEHPVMRQVQSGSLELPATEYEIRDALQKMRATRDMLTNREYSIYNCEIVPQLNEIRLDSASLDELNFLAKRLISLNEDERNIIKGIATKVIPTDEDEIVSIRDLINMTYGTGIVSVVSNVTNDEQLGEFVIENELQDGYTETDEDSEDTDSLFEDLSDETDDGLISDDYIDEDLDDSYDDSYDDGNYDE